jgi:uncharacterized protein
MAMILELAKFQAFPAHIDLVDAETRENVEMVGINSIDKTMLGLDIQKSDDDYYCRGQVEAEVSLECARCLEPIKQKLTNETDFIVSPFKQGGNIEADDEDRIYYDNELRADLWEIVRQTVILAVSMKPLCRDDCQGLCPQCGTNLNEKKCKCNVRIVDSRLESLKKLL